MVNFAGFLFVLFIFINKVSYKKVSPPNRGKRYRLVEGDLDKRNVDSENARRNTEINFIDIKRQKEVKDEIKKIGSQEKNGALDKQR